VKSLVSGSFLYPAVILRNYNQENMGGRNIPSRERGTWVADDLVYGTAMQGVIKGKRKMMEEDTDVSTSAMGE
jgi:hypothetical protein